MLESGLWVPASQRTPKSVRAGERGGLVPPEPVASDTLRGGKCPKSQTQLVPFPKLPDRLGGSATCLRCMEAPWLTTPRARLWPPRPPAHTGAMGTMPPATPAPNHCSRAPLTLGARNTRFTAQQPAARSSAGCKVTCPFVTPCSVPPTGLWPPPSRRPQRGNPANLSRVEPQRNEGGRETAPVPACADFAPETPFQKSLTAPGGVGLFVLRIWVKIVRCFAYVGMGNRYFRRNWGGGGVLSKSFHLPIPALYSRTMGTPLPAGALQTPTRGGCRDLEVPLGIHGAAGRHLPSHGCAGANQSARGSAPGSVPSPSLKPSSKPTDETCLFP